MPAELWLIGALVALTVCAPLIVLDGERHGRALSRRQRLAQRRTAVLAAREARAAEDEAWADRAAAAQEAMLFALIAQNIQTVDDLAERLDQFSRKVPARLEVVR